MGNRKFEIIVKENGKVKLQKQTDMFILSLNNCGTITNLSAANCNAIAFAGTVHSMMCQINKLLVDNPEIKVVLKLLEKFEEAEKDIQNE